jgi:hypothetical protein
MELHGQSNHHCAHLEEEKVEMPGTTHQLTTKYHAPNSKMNCR